MAMSTVMFIIRNTHKRIISAIMQHVQVIFVTEDCEHVHNSSLRCYGEEQKHLTRDTLCVIILLVISSSLLSVASEWFYLTSGFLAHFNMPPSLPSRLGLWLVLVIEQCRVLLVILWKSSCSLIQISVLAIWKIKYITVSLHYDHRQYISISYQSLYCCYFNGPQIMNQSAVVGGATVFIPLDVVITNQIFKLPATQRAYSNRVSIN